MVPSTGAFAFAGSPRSGLASACTCRACSSWPRSTWLAVQGSSEVRDSFNYVNARLGEQRTTRAVLLSFAGSTGSTLFRVESRFSMIDCCAFAIFLKTQADRFVDTPRPRSVWTCKGERHDAHSGTASVCQATACTW